MCVTCGGPVAHGPGDDSQPESVGASAPWHFWVVVVLLAAYLLWRVIDFIVWIIN